MKNYKASEKIVEEKTVFDGRTIWLRWNPRKKLDVKTKITQVSAYCVYKGKLILVRNKRGWCIPGGHPEVNEKIQETLKRELQEEACISPEDYVYQLMGWLEVRDPDNENIEGKEYAQLRFLVRVNKLNDFVADEEIFERKLVDVCCVDQYLEWANSPSGVAQIDTVKKLLAKKS